jgi:hypothetical protein
VNECKTLLRGVLRRGQRDDESTGRGLHSLTFQLNLSRV